MGYARRGLIDPDAGSTSELSSVCLLRWPRFALWPSLPARQAALRQPRYRILAALARQRRNPQPDLGRPTSPMKEKRAVLGEKWRAGGRGDGATVLAGGTSEEEEGRATCSGGWEQICSRHMRMRGSEARAREEHAGMEAAPNKRVDESTRDRPIGLQPI